jgi:hypothetical protein
MNRSLGQQIGTLDLDDLHLDCGSLVHDVNFDVLD